MKTGNVEAGHTGGSPQDEKNIQFVIIISALDALFNKKDYESTRKLWSPHYLQRSLFVPPGKDGLFNLVPTIPATMRLEFGQAVASDEFVFVHCRTSGHGAPTFVSGDWFRIKEGLFVEHWDVMQNEVSVAESLSKRPMFSAAATREPGGPGRLDAQQDKANKTLAIEAFDTLFNRREFYSCREILLSRFHPAQCGHSPGRDGLFSLVKSMPELLYEFGLP